jgi:hypothetical protein
MFGVSLTFERKKMSFNVGDKINIIDDDIVAIVSQVRYEPDAMCVLHTVVPIDSSDALTNEDDEYTTDELELVAAVDQKQLNTLHNILVNGSADDDLDEDSDD